MTKKGSTYFGRAVMAAFALVYLFPFLVSLLLSVKSKQETAKSVLSLPGTIHWENFSEAIEKAKIWRSMSNSIIVTAASVIIVIVAASMAGYAIGRQYHKKGYRLYESILTAAMMVPFQALMIPLYRMFRTFGLLNTLPGVIILIAGINMPFAIMTYIGFIIRTQTHTLEYYSVIKRKSSFCNNTYGP